ncbi:hypothetical protein PENTCL1PPCAC_16490, partial [Pristionchus entomophagus]
TSRISSCLAPACRHCFLVSWNEVAFLPVIMTFAPCLANRTAVPRPIPFDEPLTMTTLPEKKLIFF